MPVGLVGLGTMGILMAEAMTVAGNPPVAYDRDAARVALARDRGIEVVEATGNLVGRCEVVVLSLPSPAAVRSVVDTLVNAGSGALVLDTSTVDPGTAVDCRARLQAVGGEFADCPILGRPDRVGKWTVPVGGSDDVVARAAVVLAPVAARVVGVGDTGAAATLKVLNNLMLGTINAATAEVLAVAAAAGLDPGVFVDTVVDSGAASVSGLFRDVGPRAVDGDFAPVFSVRLMHKDNALALDLARSLGLRLPVGEAVQAINQAGLDGGWGDEDSIAVLKVHEARTGVPARRGKAVTVRW